MARQEQQHATKAAHSFKSRHLMVAFLLLAACLSGGCQTVKPGNSVLDRLQESATPAPRDSPSPPHEQRRAKAAMVQWLEQHLSEKYKVTVVDQRFVLTESGFTDGARIGSKASRYVRQVLGGVPQPVVWYEDEYFFSHHDAEKGYRIFLWKLDDGGPRYISMVMGSDFLPDTHERGLVGYFELVPSAKH
ncbi:hypothetical protein [Lysobacter capsici]|uniref:hypothetical protein n=1 Tax=Lysobacter capsici TaxID=435897 RepID=UPI000B09A561|nr:hypothetical protein [Lysobacter capsici]WND79975.1 hypothetical protein RJ610_22275 [Lysobacter capsici]WND85171.1 hypothetical protein RJ609_22290 [Lysobacter capsici]